MCVYIIFAFWYTVFARTKRRRTRKRGRWANSTTKSSTLRLGVFLCEDEEDEAGSMEEDEEPHGGRSDSYLPALPASQPLRTEMRTATRSFYWSRLQV